MAELIIPGYNPIIPGLVYTGEVNPIGLEGLVFLKRRDPDQQMVLDAMKVAAASLPENAVQTGETFEDSYDPQRYLKEVLSNFCHHFRKDLVEGNPKLVRDITWVFNKIGIPEASDPAPMFYSFLGSFSKSEIEQSQKPKSNHPTFYVSNLIKNACVHAALRIKNETIPERREVETSMTYSTQENPNGVQQARKLLDLVYSSFSDRSKLALVRDDTRGNTDVFAFSTLIAYARLLTSKSSKSRKNTPKEDDGESDESAFAA